MTKTIAKLIATAAMIAVALYGGTAFAISNLDAALSSMYMSNVTPPQGFNGSMGRGGFTGGMATFRTGVKPINLAYLDPPRITSGCGGIDAYGGSFSFISLQQIVALFRNIVANAGGALFHLSVQSICPICADTMTKFQKDIQDMDAQLGNTCALAHMVINTFSSDGSANQGQTLAALGSSLLGDATDMFSGLTGNGSTSQVISNQTASLPYNPNMGNLTWKALSAANNAPSALGDITGSLTSDPRESMEIVMSFLGTVVVPPTANTTDADSTAAAGGGPNNGVSGNSGANVGTGPTSAAAPYPATLKLHDLIFGAGTPAGTTGTPTAGTNANPTGTTILHCGESGTLPPAPTGCISITRNTPFTFQGTINLTKQMLYGTGGDSYNIQPDGILAEIQSCKTAICGMSTQQQDFLYSIDAPLYNMIRDAQVDWSSIPGLTRRLEKAIAYDIAIRLARSVERMARTIWSGAAGSAGTMPQIVADQIRALGMELNSMETETAQLQNDVMVARAYTEQIVKSHPYVFTNAK